MVTLIEASTNLLPISIRILRLTLDSPSIGTEQLGLR